MMSMTWIIVAAVAGLLVGGGGIAAISKPAPAPAVIVAPPDTTAKGQADAVAALTNLDIVKGLCAPEYIEKNGDGLCREMYCLAQSNSTTGAATEKTCDAISNLNNTKVILKACSDVADDRRRSECFQVFRERK
jgi:hypothetical protein